MEDLLQSVLEILVRRTGQLQALEQALLEGQAALVESSLERMDRVQSLQQSLCQQLVVSGADLNSAFQALQSAAQPGGGISSELQRMGPGVVARIERVQAAHDRIQSRVRELTGVQQALVRRSEHTLQALQRALLNRHPRYRNAGAGVIGAYSAMQE